MNGAILSIPLMANIAVSLISFIALFSLLNMLVGYCGEVVGLDGLSIESIFGYLFYPGKFQIIIIIRKKRRILLIIVILSYPPSFSSCFHHWCPSSRLSCSWGAFSCQIIFK